MLGDGVCGLHQPPSYSFYFPCSSSMLPFCSFLCWYDVALPCLISALVLPKRLKGDGLTCLTLPP
jgi:hypothetical protein